MRRHLAEKRVVRAHGAAQRSFDLVQIAAQCRKIQELRYVHLNSSCEQRAGLARSGSSTQKLRHDDDLRGNGCSGSRDPLGSEKGVTANRITPGKLVAGTQAALGGGPFVRTLYRPSPTSPGVGPGGSAAAQPQLHRN